MHEDWMVQIQEEYDEYMSKCKCDEDECECMSFICFENSKFLEMEERWLDSVGEDYYEENIS